MRGVEDVFRRLAGTHNVLYGQISVISLQRGLRELGVSAAAHNVTHSSVHICR